MKDEIINVKIHGKGKKFDLGAGKQFDSVEDLIEYYRKYPFSVSGGTQVVLYQVVVPGIVVNGVLKLVQLKIINLKMK